MLKAVFLDAEGTFLIFNPSLGEIYRNLWKNIKVEIDPHLTTIKMKKYFRLIFKEKLKPPLNGEICKKAWREVFEKAFEEYKDIEGFEEVFRKAYQFFADPECVKVVPGFRDFLVKGKQRGLKFAVISNWDCRLYPILEGHGLLSYFDGIFLGCEVGYLKPNPEIFNRALRHFGFSPQEVLMIGDTYEDDIETPKSLGMHTYHIQGNPDYKSLWEYIQNLL